MLSVRDFLPTPNLWDSDVKHEMSWSCLIWTVICEVELFLRTSDMLSSCSPAGLAVWTSALERGSVSGEPHALGEPVHDPPVPQFVPSGTWRYIWAGEQRRTAAPCGQTSSPAAHAHRPITGQCHKHTIYSLRNRYKRCGPVPLQKAHLCPLFTPTKCILAPYIYTLVP